MILKKLVAITLLISGALFAGILVGGLFMAPSTLERISNNRNVSPVPPDVSMDTSKNPNAPQESRDTTSPSPADSGSNSSPSPSPVTPSPNPSSGNPSPNPATPTPQPNPSPSPTTTPPPAPTPAPTPPPAPSCGQSGGACSSSQVASHASQTDCWVIYGGYYYIVTSYVNGHPGGKSVFNSATCGHDITSYMNGSASTSGQSHNHKSGAYNTLNSYKVGAVQ